MRNYFDQKVLITGGSGLLGGSLLKTKPPMFSHHMLATYNNNPIIIPGVMFEMGKMNLAEGAIMRGIFADFEPDLVIHTAGIGSVDAAENNPSEVFEVNVKATEILLELAEKHQAKFIYISSNAVFAGDNPPYTEASPLMPVNVYGSFKKQAEGLVMQSKDYLIIRPYMLYGWPQAGRANWATKIIEHARERPEESLKLVDDILWMPTYAMDAAKAIWGLNLYTKEVFNVASRDSMSLYDFGLMVCKVWGLPSSFLQPISKDEFSHMAPRPLNTGYDLRKLDGVDIQLAGVEEGLIAMKEEGKNV